MKILVIMSVLLMACSSGVWAQSKKDKNKENPNAFSPYAPEEEKAEVKQSKKNKKKSYRYTYNKKMDRKVKEYEKRMQANAKMDRKMEREMQKPQYSDPSYFGHKRKPKKRPVDKRKFCKECGIVH